MTAIDHTSTLELMNTCSPFSKHSGGRYQYVPAPLDVNSISGGVFLQHFAQPEVQNFYDFFFGDHDVVRLEIVVDNWSGLNVQVPNHRQYLSHDHLGNFLWNFPVFLRRESKSSPSQNSKTATWIRLNSNSPKNLMMEWWLDIRRTSFSR